MNTNQFLKSHNELLPIVGKDSFNKAKIINISELHFNQDTVDPDVVLYKKRTKKFSICYVIIINGKKILIDGHHTVIAKILSGKTSIKALTYTI